MAYYDHVFVVVEENHTYGADPAGEVG